MTATKALMGVVPLVMTASLLNEDVKYLKKKKPTTKDTINLGIKNVVGISLIGATSSMINDL